MGQIDPAPSSRHNGPAEFHSPFPRACLNPVPANALPFLNRLVSSANPRFVLPKAVIAALVHHSLRSSASSLNTFDFMSRSVILYTRPGCHLCEDAEKLLRRYGLIPRLVNIDTDPELTNRYNLTIPVVEIDGKERFRGVVNEVLLRRLLSLD